MNNKSIKLIQPFPYLKIVTIAIILFINSVSMKLIYPFVPFMVKDFFPDVLILFIK